MNLAAALLVALGLVLRLHQLDYNFSGDEIFSVDAGSGPLSHTITVALHDVHPPLYYLLLHAWIRAFGASESSVRGLSILASLFFLLTLWRVASRLLPSSLSLFALWICATSPFFVHYGQEARPYSLAACLSALSLLLLLRAWDAPSSHAQSILYGLCCAALMYTQYLALLLLLLQLSALLLSDARRHARTALYGIAGAALVGPWALAASRHLIAGHAEGISWIAQPTLSDVPAFYIGIFGWPSIRHAGSALLILIGLSFSAFGLRPGPVDRPVTTLLTALAALPPVFLFALSRHAPSSLWAPRQLIGSAVVVVLLVGLGLSLHRRPVGITIAVALALWPVANVGAILREHSAPPWRSLASSLSQDCRECDIIVFELWVHRPLAHYAAAPVGYWRDYKQTASLGRRVAVVYRPSRSSELGEVDARYRAVSERAIRWTQAVPGEENTIQIRVLEPRTP